jgi:hypothetical protein
VIAKVLAHLYKTAPDQYQPELPLGARACRRRPACFESEGEGAFGLTVEPAG